MSGEPGSVNDHRTPDENQATESGRPLKASIRVAVDDVAGKQFQGDFTTHLDLESIAYCWIQRLPLLDPDGFFGAVGFIAFDQQAAQFDGFSREVELRARGRNTAALFPGNREEVVGLA